MWVMHPPSQHGPTTRRFHRKKTLFKAPQSLAKHPPWPNFLLKYPPPSRSCFSSDNAAEQPSLCREVRSSFDVTAAVEVVDIDDDMNDFPTDPNPTPIATSIHTGSPTPTPTPTPTPELPPLIVQRTPKDRVKMWARRTRMERKHCTCHSILTA
ncbi:hypothetical protein PIB30_023544 [Stylosanthes scabra]|uniref:Uncharacterized protein n=1 Tax=Stylosanthes scabra TaxID=79078 RepID=A0ABU6V8G4_9FABA|nr:hypothetical protein [Stylosanthes scabra]